MPETDLDEYRERAEGRIRELRSKLDDLEVTTEEDEGAGLDLAARERLEEADQAWRRAELRLQDLREATEGSWAEERERYERERDTFEEAVRAAAGALGESFEDIGVEPDAGEPSEGMPPGR